jgi:spermidine synthase
MKNIKHKGLLFALAMIGFTATAGQIVLVREFIVIFYGNELCLGVILANWLLWGAVGSLLLGRFADKLKRKIGTLAICEILLAILLPALIFVIRSARVLLKAQPGELIGFIPMVAFSFVILAPMCIILGFLFALGARIFPSAKGAKQIGYTYILEGVGASVGGLLTSLLLIRYLNSFQIAMIIGALDIAASASLRIFLGKGKLVKIFFRGLIILLLIVNVYLILPENTAFIPIESLNKLKSDSLDSESLKIQWGMLGLKESKNSIYSNLTVVGTEDTYTFFSNGLSMFSVPDPASAEQTSHFAMLEHPDPQKVLLISGGVSGSLGEILKHPTKKVDYVELDPAIIELAKNWLDNKDLAPLNDPRVTIENIDGRRFVKQSKEKYSVVILDLPEPFTAQLNRFYTQEFFQEIYNVLDDKGIFSIGVLSSANYLSDEHQAFLNCVYQTLDSVFTDIITIPADDQILFLSCKSKGILSYSQELLTERLRQRKIQALYVSEYQMPIYLEPWRIQSFSDRIRETKNIKINKDLQPVSYYYDMLLWSAQFSTVSKLQAKYNEVFKFTSRLNLWWFLLPFFLIGLLLFLLGNWKKGVRHRYILLAVLVTGFAEIAFEVIVSLGFQIIYGYMYYKLGLILTAFMIGLIGGGIVITKIMDRLKNELLTFVYTQVAICIYPLLLLLAFYIFKGGFAYSFGANVVFPLLPVVAGFMGGFQFPLATRIYLKYNPKVGRVAGLTYGVDLAGACIGAFLVSAFLVPIIGIQNTCFAIIILGVIVLMLLFQGLFKAKYR